MKILDLTINEFTDGLECVIEYIHWEHEGIKGTTKLKPPKSIFKPLEQLTDDEIIAWVWATDADKIAKFKRNKRLARKISFGELPELSEEAEQAKKDYWVKWANARLAQHVLLDGQAEVREMQPTGEQVFNEDTMEMEDVLVEVVVKREIEPVEEFVEQAVYSDEYDAEPTVEQVRNPLVVQDEEERAKAIEILEKYNDR
jgi:uncharacterized protein (DUF924 family)